LGTPENKQLRLYGEVFDLVSDPLASAELSCLRTDLNENQFKLNASAFHGPSSIWQRKTIAQPAQLITANLHCLDIRVRDTRSGSGMPDTEFRAGPIPLESREMAGRTNTYRYPLFRQARRLREANASSRNTMLPFDKPLI
jgi:hypothetical protein